MLTPNVYDVTRARQVELMRQAQEHNHNRALLGRSDSAPLYAALLNKVGQELVVLGETLQTRYGDLLEEAQQANRPNTSSTVGY